LALLSVSTLSGLALGSYVVTASMRHARGEGSLAGRSHCDHCNTTLGFIQTVPVISFVRTGGVCATCKGSIDVLHLVGEITGGLVLLAAIFVYDPFRSPMLAVLGLALLASSTFDWRTGRLPDKLTLVVTLAAGALSLLRGPMSLGIGVASAAVAFLVLQSVRWWMVSRGKDAGLGFGDVKLVCALALWLGPTTTWMVAGASALGLLAMAILRPADGRLPFGPAIALSGWTIGIGAELGAWPST
jgi:leader peptidase (prepilin peptidase) / N-methyltransferase